MPIQSLGVGSGLDVNSIVSQLIAVERAPVQNRLNRREFAIQADLSAFGSLKGALSELESAAEKLGDGDLFESRSATVTDNEWFSASATSGAVLGSVSVEVESLAASQRLQSAAFTSADTDVGTGTLNIAAGLTTISLDLDSENNTLADIRDAINAAEGNDAVTASLISGDEGVRLVLTSNHTGIDNKITVTASGGDGGLDQLVYNEGVLTNLSQVRPPADARVFIDGVQVSSDNNVIEGALEGVTLTLKQANPGETTSLDIGRNTSAVSGSLNGFIKAFNAVLDTINRVSDAEPGGASGPLVGDPLTRGIENRIRNIMGGVLEGTFSSFSELGISSELGGKLSLDSARLAEALAADSQAVAELFGGEGGIASQLESVLGGLLGSNGQIEARTQGLNQRLESITDSRESLALRLEKSEARLIAQFSAMDALVSQLQSTGSFLTQQLASIERISTPRNGS